MKEMKCSSCGGMLKEGEPHCNVDKAAMTCDAEKCVCTQCGNTVMTNEIKCDMCLAA